MPKGPKIKEWVRWYIRTEALKNHAEPRESVAERIETYLDGKEPVPSRDTLNKIISSARNSPGPEDRPWSLSALTLPDCDIPPEALPVVMKAWAKALEQDKPLTIRHAKWIARLYCVLGYIGDLNICELTIQALEYANREKAIKATGGYPEKPQDMRWLWLGDAILYLNLTEDDSLVKKCMRSMKGQLTTGTEELEVKLKIEQDQNEKEVNHNER